MTAYDYWSKSLQGCCHRRSIPDGFSSGSPWGLGPGAAALARHSRCVSSVCYLYVSNYPGPALPVTLIHADLLWFFPQFLVCRSPWLLR